MEDGVELLPQFKMIRGTLTGDSSLLCLTASLSSGARLRAATAEPTNVNLERSEGKFIVFAVKQTNLK